MNLLTTSDRRAVTARDKPNRKKYIVLLTSLLTFYLHISGCVTVVKTSNHMMCRSVFTLNSDFILNGNPDHIYIHINYKLIVNKTLIIFEGHIFLYLLLALSHVIQITTSIMSDENEEGHITLTLSLNALSAFFFLYTFLNLSQRLPAGSFPAKASDQ